jgi:hypothetical protein
MEIVFPHTVEDIEAAGKAEAICAECNKTLWKAPKKPVKLAETKAISGHGSLWVWELLMYGNIMKWPRPEPAPGSDDEYYDEKLEHMKSQYLGKKSLFNLGDYKPYPYPIVRQTERFIYVKNWFYDYYKRSKTLRVERKALEAKGWFYNNTIHRVIYRNKALAKMLVAYETGATSRLMTELGLDLNAGAAELKAQYRRLVKIHHPDRGGDPNMFQFIYETFKNAVA